VPSGLKGIVFDFGNVLYDVDYPAMAARLAGERADEFLRRFVGGALQVAYETGRIGLDELLAGFAREGFPFGRDRFLAEYLSVFSPVLGMNAVLERLAERFPLGLLSNTSPEHARLFIESVPEFAQFSAHVYSFEVGEMKPAPALYRVIAERLGLRATELVYVDDIVGNVEGARAVGMVGVHFRGRGPLVERLGELGLNPSGGSFA
jgi:FMN phosphatase YigB (HAD superfamily)